MPILDHLDINGITLDLTDAALTEVVSHKVDSAERLPSVESLAATDVLYINIRGTNYQIKYSDLKLMLGSNPGLTCDNDNGTITLTYTGGTKTITPHDPTKQDNLTFDNTPTLGSTNPATSNGIKVQLNRLDANATAMQGSIEDINALDGEQNDRLDTLEIAQESYINGSYEDGDYNVFTHNDVEVFRLLKGNGGGGGGGGGGTAPSVMTITNTSGWISKTIAKGASCPISFEWSSTENGIPTGDGQLEVFVGGISCLRRGIAQGAVTVNVGNYLANGKNTVTIQVADLYAQTRTIKLIVTVEELTIRSPWDSSQIFTDEILFPFTPVGEVEKTVHFIVDGTEIGTLVTDVSNRQVTYTIPKQSHGGHSLLVYFEAVVNEQVVRSNELYYEFIAAGSDNTPIIVSPYNETQVEQYTTVNIPFTVYTPSSLTSEVTIKINGTTVSTQTVDRTEQTFSRRLDDTGAVNIVISSGTASKTISLTVTESTIDVHAETRDLALHLTSQGRSNNEAHPEIWQDTDHDVTATMTGFNFKTDGWVQDDDGVTVCRVAGDARVTIPFQIFAQDFRTTGKTIEIEFATREVLNYDAPILTCLNENRGISMTAQRASLRSSLSEIAMQYKEDEHVRIAFVVEKVSENRLMFVYVNGIMSGALVYPTGDDFSQTTPAGISIGSNLCTMDIYNIRVYDNDLTRHQILDNWIADTQSVDVMLARYNRNNVYDAYGNIIIENLPGSLPYMILSNCVELPQYKGDKKTCDITYVDPVNPAKSFTATNVQIDVQGTSSQYYARKNYKIKAKNGFVVNGSTVDDYALRDGEIPVNVFCFKADVASSEGANNVELARLYNEACPYKTPAQVENSAVRQGIDGFPMVIFHNDGTRQYFLGKYNFNNDKSTEETFGFMDGDESIEILNNTGNRVIWKSADYTGTDWQNDFEFRYPDTDPAYTNVAQLAEFATWIVSTDPEQATGDTLPEPVTYVDGEESTTYTTDSAAYRLAKFRAELGNYAEIDSALFFYLFTELFLMVDNRAKNVFPSFIGTAVNA